MNQMTVTNIAVLDDEVDVTTARDRVVAGHSAAANVSALAAVAGVCNSASFDEETIDQPIGLRLVHGDATDSAILRFAESIRPVKASQGEWQEVFKMNFNSKTKYMMKVSLLCLPCLAKLMRRSYDPIRVHPPLFLPTRPSAKTTTCSCAKVPLMSSSSDVPISMIPLEERRFPFPKSLLPV
jgi:hypothetical protein